MWKKYTLKSVTYFLITLSCLLKRNARCTVYHTHVRNGSKKMKNIFRFYFIFYFWPAGAVFGGYLHRWRWTRVQDYNDLRGLQARSKLTISGKQFWPLIFFRDQKYHNMQHDLVFWSLKNRRCGSKFFNLNTSFWILKKKNWEMRPDKLLA